MNMESANINQENKTVNKEKLVLKKKTEEEYRGMLSSTSVAELDRLEKSANAWITLSNQSVDGSVHIQGFDPSEYTREEIEKKLQMIQEEKAKRQVT